MYKRYSGEFLSRHGVRWRADIYQEADSQFEGVEELKFPADGPLTLEWSKTDKEEPICGSTASLTIISPGDRTYEDLYTIRPGSVRLDVYRQGILYWSGALDSEFYEEPYSSYNEYEVKLTFSDFGILNRCRYTLEGNCTLMEVMQHILSRSGIFYRGINQEYISSQADGRKLSLDVLSIRSGNFYDEDGEAETLYDVMEAILQPLALRVVQRQGVIWIYDLNGLYTQATTDRVEWVDQDQILGVDKVANNAVVTFSPYSGNALISSDLKYEDEYSEEKTNMGSDCPSGGLEYYSYYTDYSRDWADQLMSFTIFLSDKGSGVAAKHPGSKYFHIQPLMGGTEASGVAYSFYTGGHGDLNSGWPKRKLNNPAAQNQSVLMRTHRTAIQALGSEEQKQYYLRLSLDMLLDPRYNPFTQAGRSNEEGNYNNWKVGAGYVFVPASITVYDENGVALMHYNNEGIAQGTNGKATLFSTKGEWKQGAAPYGSCWLSWYDPNDRAESSGVLGWKTNRHCIGLNREELYKSFAQMDEGQYILYPPVGGFLEVCIYTGVRLYDYGETNWDDMHQAAKRNLWNQIRWMLYKAPKVEMVKNNITFSAVKSDDVEYSGSINADAKEDIKIDTMCGTMKATCPTARGTYLWTASGLQLKELTRGGRTTQAEQLLIGTLYSQYASRKTRLAGTVHTPAGALRTFAEDGQEGKRFISLSEVHDVITDESEITLVELRPDEYKAEDE